MMKPVILLLALAGLGFGEPERIPVWPGPEAPDGQGGTTPATTSLTLHRPEHPNGTAMIICPGGGYGGLVMDQEGHGIARWLNSHGITRLVLEYRLPQGEQPSAAPVRAGADRRRRDRLRVPNARKDRARVRW